MFGLQIAIVLLFFLPFCFFTVLLSFIVSEFVSKSCQSKAGAGGAVWFKKNQNVRTSSQPFWIQPPCLPS